MRKQCITCNLPFDAQGNMKNCANCFAEKKVCEYCKNSFTTPRYQSKETCSKTCKYALRKKRNALKFAPVKCKTCRTIFLPRNKKSFCSKRCLGISKHKPVHAGHTVCARCKQSKHLSQFSRDAKVSNVHLSYCKTCASEIGKLRTSKLKAQALQQGVNRAESRTCSKCKVGKSANRFSPNLATKTKLHAVCKECMMEYRHSNKDKLADRAALRRIEKQYGMTLEGYNELLSKQGGVCAICKQPERVKVRRRLTSLCVDHDHGTGKVRGLLCNNCNSGIGYLRDSAALLQNAIAYLQSAAH
jgi:hypothetical protein